jgi:mannose-1-phosphate guanylyltransferase
MSRWAVVLAGGVGSRFWPVSTPQRPKQLLPLVTSEPMLAATLRRLAPLAPPKHTLVLTNASLTGAVREMAPDLPPRNVIAEPRPAGTAAALAWAADAVVRLDGPDAVMLCVHADWAIGDEVGFREALERAARAAEKHHALITIGVVPTRPDPGFGYIQPGDMVQGEALLRRVARFVEKPDRQRAEAMVREGYLWNSGIFAWRAGDFLAEVRSLTPEVAPALENAAGDATRFFAEVQPIAVDVGVLERSSRVMMLPGDFAWDDVGTWAALGRVRGLDAQGNAVSGSVFAHDAARNVVHADAGTVILYGVSDLVVVTRDGLTLVTTRDHSADLKRLIEALPPSVREPG